MDSFGSRGLSDQGLDSLGPGGPSDLVLPRALVLVLALVQLVSYGGVFGFVYVQLWLVLRYGHKRLSFQTAFLGLVLLWAGLRTLLVSFYFSSWSGSMSGPSLSPGPGLYWVLYGLPVCLQFTTLGLMTLYCAQVFFKAKSKSSPALLKFRPVLYLVFVAAVMVFSVVNLVCALLVRCGPGLSLVSVLVLVRVVVNDGLFVLSAVVLAVCLFKVATATHAIGLSAKGPSVCQLTLLGLALVLVYGSRTCYNLTVLSLSRTQPEPGPGSGPGPGPRTRTGPGLTWFHVTDQADLSESMGDPELLVLGLVLFVFELLPSALAVYVFRVRKPPSHMASVVNLPSHVLSSRGYFFDNPHRYDSDDDLSWTHRASSECDFGDEQRLTTSSGELHHYP